RRVFEHLPAGGIILLSGWMLGDGRSPALLPILFCIEDIVLGAPDIERSVTTYMEWLAEAGFEGLRHMLYFEPASLLVGRKPVVTRGASISSRGAATTTVCSAL